MKMLAFVAFLVSLCYIQGVSSGRLYPRLLFDQAPGSAVIDTNILHQGGAMGSPFHRPFGPGGDPIQQQQNNQHSMTPGGSCVPSLSDCACPNNAFRTPSGCYFCHCLGYHAPDQVSPTSGVGIPSTVLAVVNNQTPPTSKKTSPSTIAVATRTTSAPSTGQCQSAARLCQMNCPGGYLVDPDDCTFCVCKKNTMAARPQLIN